MNAVIAATVIPAHMMPLEDEPALLPDHPLAKYSTIESRGNTDFTDPQLCVPFADYVHCFVEKRCHEPFRPGRLTKCKCRASIKCKEENKSALVTLLLSYAAKNWEERQNFIIDALRYGDATAASKSKGKKQSYLLLGLEDAKSRPLYVCKSTFLELYGVGGTAYKGMRDWMKENGPAVRRVHKHKGCLPNSAKGKEYIAAKERAIAFLADVKKRDGEEHATRFVKLMTGIVTRDDKDTVELPSSYSKRRLYVRHCYENGHVVVSDAKGNFGKMNKYAYRDDDDFAPADRKSVVSYPTFLNLWKKNFPELVIRPPSRDICDDCVKFKNLWMLDMKVRSAYIYIYFHILHIIYD